MIPNVAYVLGRAKCQVMTGLNALNVRSGHAKIALNQILAVIVNFL